MYQKNDCTLLVAIHANVLCLKFKFKWEKIGPQFLGRTEEKACDYTTALCVITYLPDSDLQGTPVK